MRPEAGSGPFTTSMTSMLSGSTVTSVVSGISAAWHWVKAEKPWAVQPFWRLRFLDTMVPSESPVKPLQAVFSREESAGSNVVFNNSPVSGQSLLSWSM